MTWADGTLCEDRWCRGLIAKAAHYARRSDTSMARIKAAHRRLGSESGFSLVELLITATLLVVMLLAVLSITDATKRRATADSERSVTVSSSEVGIARMSRELRQACAIFVPGVTPSTGQYCFNQFSTAPAATACTNLSDCIDFVERGRSCYTRAAGGGVTLCSTAHPLKRVRYDCGDSPVTSFSLTRTRCARFEGSCGPTSCASPTTRTGNVLGRSVLNATNGQNPSSPNAIFQYCARGSVYSCTLTPTTTVTSTSTSGQASTAGIGALRVSLRVSRRGTRASGNTTSFFLQSGIELRNIVNDASAS
jgi:Tfp pilus assembly protein PilV